MLFFGGIPSIEIIIGVLLAALIGMTVHEFAHNYVAHLMGDPNPARQGRLTLDPSKHIYWPGFIMFVLIGFGILGLAPISAARMKNPRWGYLAAVAAGPLSNLLVAILFGIAFRLLTFLPPSILIVIAWIVTFNILLFLFNLLPLFPLDGWHMVYTLLPPEQADWWGRNAQTTQIVFLGLILLSFFPLGNFNILGILIGEPLFFLRNLILF